MNRRENESFFTTLLLFLLIFLMLIAGAGVFGLYLYRSAVGARQNLIRMEMMAQEAAMVAQEQARLAQEAKERIENLQKEGEPTAKP